MSPDRPNNSIYSYHNFRVAGSLSVTRLIGFEVTPCASLPSLRFRLLVRDTVSPSLHRVRKGLFPSLFTAVGRSDSPSSFPIRFVAFAARYRRLARVSLLVGRGRPAESWRFGVRTRALVCDEGVGASQVPGEPWWPSPVLFDPGGTQCNDVQRGPAYCG